MPRQSTTRSFVFQRTAAELRIEQRQETAKCLLGTAMRRCRQKEQVVDLDLPQFSEATQIAAAAEGAPTQECASSTITNGGHARPKLSRRFSALM